MAAHPSLHLSLDLDDREYARLQDAVSRLPDARGLLLYSTVDDGRIVVLVDHPSLYAPYRFAPWTIEISSPIEQIPPHADTTTPSPTR